MRYLLDTNIHLRFAFKSASQSVIVRNAIEKLKQDGQELLVTIQNQAEFWNVATRPRNRNGYGLNPQQANYYLGLVEKAFPLVTESKDSHRIWRKLVME